MYNAYVEMAAASPDKPISPSDAVAWMDIHGVRDRQWWWQMIKKLDSIRSDPKLHEPQGD